MAEEDQDITSEPEMLKQVPLRMGSVLAVNLVMEKKFSSEYEYRFILFPTDRGLKILKRNHDNIRIGNLRDQTIVIGDSMDDLI